jgi:hypothetical protein
VKMTPQYVQRKRRNRKLAFLLGFLVIGPIVALLIIATGDSSSQSTAYRRSDGTWSDDPINQGAEVMQALDKQAAERQSDCRTGRGRNPYCP